MNLLKKSLFWIFALPLWVAFGIGVALYLVPLLIIFGMAHVLEWLSRES